MILGRSSNIHGVLKALEYKRKTMKAREKYGNADRYNFLKKS